MRATELPMSDKEIIERILAWRLSDSDGYNTALELLCDIESALEQRSRRESR